MVDYARALAAATRGIQGSGRLVSFVKLPATAADPLKPLHGPAPVDEDNPEDRLDDITATFVALGSGTLGIEGISVDLFKNCEQVALVEVPPGGQDLIGYHLIIDGATRWYIRRIQELKPGNVTLLYFVGVARTRVENT